MQLKDNGIVETQYHPKGVWFGPIEEPVEFPAVTPPNERCKMKKYLVVFEAGGIEQVVQAHSYCFREGIVHFMFDDEVFMSFKNFFCVVDMQVQQSLIEKTGDPNKE